MSSLENLPIELIRHAVLLLDEPSDLLHVALTCRFFYELIIPTRQLDLTSISCCDSKTPLKFWQILGASRHYASMIRQLELCDQLIFDDLALWRRRFRGRRVDGKLVGTPGWDSLPVSADLNPQRLFFNSLANMWGLKSISLLMMTAKDSVEEYDCLFHMSKNFSNSLEVLHLYYGEMGLPLGPIPQYKSSDFTFHRLTSFSLGLSVSVTLGSPFDLLLTSLASNCPALVNFAFRSFSRFPIVRLIKKAAWPGLKKLTIGGSLQLADDDTSEKEIFNVYLSFFTRHTQLESLCISSTDYRTRPFLAELIRHLSPVLPSLQSLNCDCLIPPDILSRLVHATNGFYHYSFAQSLRSCIIDRIDFSRVQAVIQAMPQLERLCLILEYPYEEEADGYTRYFDASKKFFDDLPEIVGTLENLTHLEISDPSGTGWECHPDDFVDYLGNLKYFRYTDENEMADSGWQQVVLDDTSSPFTYIYPSLNDSPDQSFRSEFWGDFFMGPVMDPF